MWLSVESGNCISWMVNLSGRQKNEENDTIQFTYDHSVAHIIYYLTR